MGATIIRQLLSVPGLKVECPNCQEEISLKKARLFSMYGTCPPQALTLMQTRRQNAQEIREEVKARRKQLAKDRMQKPQRISVSTEATNFGQRCEQIVPAFVTFPYIQGDCRILFKPVDYVVFAGLCDQGTVQAVKFVEFKTGGGTLNLKQRQIRDCVLDGKVKHEVIGT